MSCLNEWRESLRSHNMLPFIETFYLDTISRHQEPCLFNLLTSYTRQFVKSLVGYFLQVPGTEGSGLLLLNPEK